MFKLFIIASVLCTLTGLDYVSAREFTLHEDSRVLFASDSRPFGSFEPKGRVDSVFIPNNTDINEAKEIVRHIHEHTQHWGPHLRQIDLVTDGDSPLRDALRPLLRELITPENGFIALRNPWWVPSPMEQLTTILGGFLASFTAQGEKKEHIKVH